MAKLTKSNKELYTELVGAFHEMIRAYLANNRQDFEAAVEHIKEVVEDDKEE